MPYLGAISDVNLNSHNLTANQINISTLGSLASSETNLVLSATNNLILNATVANYKNSEIANKDYVDTRFTVTDVVIEEEESE